MTEERFVHTFSHDNIEWINAFNTIIQEEENILDTIERSNYMLIKDEDAVLDSKDIRFLLKILIYNRKQKKL